FWEVTQRTCRRPDHSQPIGEDVGRSTLDVVESPRDRTQGSKPLTSRYRLVSSTSRASIPSFFIRAIRVVRLRPRRAAAPFAPPTRPLVSPSTLTIVCCSSQLPAFAGTALAPSFVNSGAEAGRVVSGVSIAARSTRLLRTSTILSSLSRLRSCAGAPQAQLFLWG